MAKEKLGIVSLTSEQLHDALGLPAGVKIDAIRGTEGMAGIEMRVSGALPLVAMRAEGQPIMHLVPLWAKPAEMNGWQE